MGGVQSSLLGAGPQRSFVHALKKDVKKKCLL